MTVTDMVYRCFQGYRDGYPVKSIDSSSIRLRLNSQYPHGSSQPSILLPWDPVLFSGLQRNQTHMQCTNIQAGKRPNT